MISSVDVRMISDNAVFSFWFECWTNECKVPHQMCSSSSYCELLYASHKKPGCYFNNLKWKMRYTIRMWRTINDHVLLFFLEKRWRFEFDFFWRIFQRNYKPRWNYTDLKLKAKVVNEWSKWGKWLCTRDERSKQLLQKYYFYCKMDKLAVQNYLLMIIYLIVKTWKITASMFNSMLINCDWS